MLQGRLIARQTPICLASRKLLHGKLSSLRWNSSAVASASTETATTSTTTTTEEKTEKQVSPLLTNSRGVKLPPRDQRFVILSAKASSILPRQKPKRITQAKLEFKSDQLDAQLKRLLVFRSEVPQEVVLESIQQLKPTTPSVSEKRYDQLFNDILRAYTAPQLRHFIREYAKSGFPGGKSLKRDLVKFIVTKHWNVQKSKDISESTDVIVENTLNLSRRDLFLIISRNGQLPRYWTKSGAKIVILGEEQKIVVRSTADTFEWINASMVKALNNVTTKEFDVSVLQSIVDVEKLPLDKISRLSDVFIEREGNKLVASSFGQQRVDQAERLILGSSGFGPGLVESFLCDVNEENLKKSAYSTVIEDESLSWIHRNKEWNRWRFLRHKIQKEERESDSIELNIANIFDSPKKSAPLQSNVDEPEHPAFKLILHNSVVDGVEVSNQNSISESYTQAISQALLTTYNSQSLDESLDPNKDQSNITIAATFGFILHEGPMNSDRRAQNVFSDQSKKEPLATTFLSNIPSVSEFSRTLPLFAPVSEHEDLSFDVDLKPDANIRLNKTGELELEPTNDYFVKGKSPAEAIEDLFDEPENFGKSHNSGIISDEHSYYVQMKFLPSPFHTDINTSLDPAKFENLPPIELWLEVDENERADKSSISIVAVDREANTYASMPHMNADIKFSAAKTRFLDTNQHTVDEFLAKSTLDFSGKVRINTPNVLYLALNGDEGAEPVPYLYQTMLYRKQVDLDYNGQILQLATIEGGLVGGHRIEANLVLDAPASEFCPDHVEKLVRGALSYLNDIQPHNMRLR